MTGGKATHNVCVQPKNVVWFRSLTPCWRMKRIKTTHVFVCWQTKSFSICRAGVVLIFRSAAQAAFEYELWLK